MFINKGWINKLWYICRIEYHSAVKMNEFNICYAEMSKIYSKVKKSAYKIIYRNSSILIFLKIHMCLYRKATYRLFFNLTFLKRFQI